MRHVRGGAGACADSPGHFRLFRSARRWRGRAGESTAASIAQSSLPGDQRRFVERMRRASAGIFSEEEGERGRGNLEYLISNFEPGAFAPSAAACGGIFE